MSIEGEEDSGFLQNGMERSAVTMGPGTAPPPSPTRFAILAKVASPSPARGFPVSWCTQPGPSGISGVTFLGFWGLAWDDCSPRGRDREPMGCSSSASRVEPAVQRWGGRGRRGDAPFPLVASPAVPGLRGYPG